MATFQFTPSSTSAFTFSPTLDGSPYNATVTWNLAGQRWYVTLKDNNGNVVFTLPLIESPDNFDISITDGYFASTLVFRESTQTFIVTP